MNRTFDPIPDFSIETRDVSTFSKDMSRSTLAARDFSSAVFGFCQVFIVIRVFLAATAVCRPSADKSHRTREKPLVPLTWYPR